jgi:hypothetical protein
LPGNQLRGGFKKEINQAAPHSFPAQFSRKIKERTGPQPVL